MKRIRIWAVFISMVTFAIVSSCGKDEVKSDVANVKIVGHNIETENNHHENTCGLL